MISVSPFPTAPVLASDRRARWLLLGLFTLSVIFACITKGTYDSGDSIKHYLYARYAFQHPLNFLDTWAKPLFTLLASGPAQGGWLGMKFFQCVVVAVSAWCAYVVARALRLPVPELAILFCYAAPDYFLIQYSGLTEPLFGLVLVGSVALAVSNRPGWSAALISWLPFVRSEGFILIGIWAVYLAWRREWRLLPLLVLGYVVYSAVGALVLGEVGWVFGRNPYATISVYGHGPWNHFLRNIPNLLGWVLTALFVLGGGRMVRDCTQADRRQWPWFSAELLLVYGSITVFVAAHTIFWALGLFNSFGLARVLAVTTPLAAVVALNGLAGLLELSRSETVRHRILIGATVAVAVWPFTGARNAFRWQRDFKQTPDQQIADQAGEWFRQQHAAGPPPPLAFEFPYLAVALHNDTFAPEEHPPLVAHGQPNLDGLPVGTLVFWDDWYLPVECRIPLKMMQADPRYRFRWQTALPRDPRHPERDTARIIVFERIR